MPNKCPANYFFPFFHFNWLTFLIFNTVIWHFNNNVNVQISPLWEKLKDFVTIDYAPYGKAEVLVCKINHIVFLQKYLSQTISLKTHPISETVFFLRLWEMATRLLSYASMTNGNARFRNHHCLGKKHVLNRIGF